MPNPLDELQVDVWVLAALGRLAGQGLLDAPAPHEDPLATVSRRLLVEAGWLDSDPLRPSQRLLDLMPPGVPLAAASGFVLGLLGMVSRYAAGAPAGWSELDAELIRWRSRNSGAVASRIFDAAFGKLPGFANQLDRAGSVLLDVGVGGAGICITMCQRHGELRAVGLDINPSAIAVARDEVAAAGLAERIEIREQSVVDIDHVAAFDLIWLPQPFLPRPVLAQAIPSLYRAARPNGALVMPMATNQYDGPLGASVDVRNHVFGGGSITPETAESLLAAAGFEAVQALQVNDGIVMLARVAG